MARKKFQWSRGEDDSEGEFHFTERASRSKRAREEKRIVALARGLVRLEVAKLDDLPLTEEVLEAVQHARRLRARGGVKGAMRRQMLLVATVLRRQDPEALASLLEATGA